MFDQFWAGPEISASSDAFSTQYRAGAHLTGFKLDALEWSAAVGYVTDSYHRSGVYGRISKIQDDDTLMLKIAENMQIKVTRQAIERNQKK